MHEEHRQEQEYTRWYFVRIVHTCAIWGIIVQA